MVLEVNSGNDDLMSIVTDLQSVDVEFPINEAAVCRARLSEEHIRKIFEDSRNTKLKAVIYDSVKHYAEIDTLIEIYMYSEAARAYINDNAGSIKETDRLKKLSAFAKAAQNNGLAAKILPNLSYPEFAPELRAFVTSVKDVPREIRRAALEKIPRTDEAYTKRYCCYCGSDAVDTKREYKGMAFEVDVYGYECYACGHKSTAPEGMGQIKPFDVSFEKLV